uniref:Uncharacterized protein n=1 Tax=Anguilla anguilla TaxID=7936 RepID=A0A0E9Q6H7_ANGAN
MIMVTFFVVPFPLEVGRLL